MGKSLVRLGFAPDNGITNMRWSSLFIPTLRDKPADAEAISHALLVRAGYIRQVSAGIYSYLYLAQRSLQKIMTIVREEMNAIGAQEFYLPALNPAEIWHESGRWQSMGENMFRLKDRFGRPLCLAMTHEEVMTFIARGELRSYKQLPQIWYQIQTKFRDEARPKSGLLRVRQFIMKDSYSFDLDLAGLDRSYESHRSAYRRIFQRCGLDFAIVQADSGAMGGSQSEEFMVASEAGEDRIAICKTTGYAANIEKAVSRPVPPALPDDPSPQNPEEVFTPDKRSIQEVASFLKVDLTSIMKCLVMVADAQPVLVLLRGDHELSETKFVTATGAREYRQALPDEVQGWLNCEVGFIGPVGVTDFQILVDQALEGRKNMICGANRKDFHFKNVTPGEDFNGEYVSLRQVMPGDTELTTGAPLEIIKTIEIGHIFKLGYKYSRSMNLKVLAQNGEEVHPIMGSYGIGIERILCAAVELYSDEAGMSLSSSIAPFDLVLLPIGITTPAIRSTAEKLYEELTRRGIQVLYDDREESAGVRFKDADLIGVPFRLTLGKKMSQGVVEVYTRRTRQTQDVSLDTVVSVVARAILPEPRTGN